MPRYLAIDLDPQGLFVASSKAGGGFALEGMAALADDLPRIGSETAEAIGQRLRRLLKDARIAPAPALVCIGRERVVFKDVKFPAGPPDQEPALVRFQAQKDLIGPPDDVLMDYLPTPTFEGEQGRKATALFMQKAYYEAAREICEAAGLKLQGVTPRPYAAAAAVRHAIATGAVPAPEEAGAAIAHLGVWNKGGEFAVVQGNRLLFSRTVPLSSLGTEAALVGDVKRSLAAFASQFPHARLAAVVYSEGDVPGGGWAGRLQAALPVPVHAYDPLAEAGPVERVPANLRGRFYGVVGLLAARLEGALSPNFVSPRVPRAAANPKRTRYLVGGLLAALAFGVLFAIGMTVNGRLTRKIKDFTAQKAQREEEVAALEVDRARLAAADEFINREIPWIDVVYDVDDVFPSLDKMRLVEIDGTVFVPPTTARAAAPPAPAAALPGGAAPPRPAGAPQGPAAPAKVKQGTLRLVVVAEEDALPEKLKDLLGKEKGIDKVVMAGGGAPGAGGNKYKQFSLGADLFRRPPGEFVRRIPPPAPRKSEPEKKVEPDPLDDPNNPGDPVPVPVPVPEPVPDEGENP